MSTCGACSGPGARPRITGQPSVLTTSGSSPQLVSSPAACRWASAMPSPVALTLGWATHRDQLTYQMLASFADPGLATWLQAHPPLGFPLIS
jgi:hypothetical protein